MRRNRSLVYLLIVLVLACTTIWPPLGGTSAQAGGGRRASPVEGYLRRPAGFPFLKDGRIVYLERGTGQIHIYDEDQSEQSLLHGARRER